MTTGGEYLSLSPHKVRCLVLNTAVLLRTNCTPPPSHLGSRTLVRLGHSSHTSSPLSGVVISPHPQQSVDMQLHSLLRRGRDKPVVNRVVHNNNEGLDLILPEPTEYRTGQIRAGF